MILRQFLIAMDSFKHGIGLECNLVFTRGALKRISERKVTAAQVPVLNVLDCWMSFCILLLVAGTQLYVQPASKGLES